MNEKYNQFLNTITGKRTDSEEIIKLIEELSELQKELCNHLLGKGDREHIVEEIGDVKMLLSSIERIFNVTEEEIEQIVEKKINRTYIELGMFDVNPHNLATEKI